MLSCKRRKRREETAGKKSPQKEYKKRMKGEEEDEDGRPPNVTGSITFTPSAPSSSSSLNQQSAKKKERKTMAFSSSQQISIAVSACTLVLAILFDQIGKRRRRNRLKNDQKKKVNAKIMADGSIKHSKVEGSIHKVAATILGAESCNGWTYWHYNMNGSMVPIDNLRQRLISNN